MKIINTIGGLGNQMFCYAFALVHKLKHNDEVFVDISHFNHYGLHDGFQINEIFDTQEIKIASPKEISKLTRYIPHYKLSRIARRFLPSKSKEYIEKKDYVFDEKALNYKGDAYYEGYWQSPKYFEDFKQEIIKMFTFPTPVLENKSLEEEMQKTESVSIHIRRGDYLNAKSFMGICEIDYYKKAIEEIQNKTIDAHYYIFSNDIQWCIENIKPILNTENIKFISHNKGKESYWDMYLMSCCKNMIIANSSFSWWAAYLNKNKNPIVISPKKWVNRDYNTEVHLSNWIKI